MVYKNMMTKKIILQCINALTMLLEKNYAEYVVIDLNANCNITGLL